MTHPEPGSGPLDDVVAEAERLAGLLAASTVRARFLGGLGVRLHAHSGVPAALARPYGDLDLVVERKDARRYRDLLVAAGYEENRRFNSLHGATRLMHVDPASGRPVDTFVGEFRMCHALPLDGALDGPYGALSPADLLLTKLQVVEVNAKDLTDVLLLLVDHRLDDGQDGISPTRLAAIAGRDWGWYTTLMDNLAKAQAHVRTVGDLAPQLVDHVAGRLVEVIGVLEASPKSLGWRTRARLGRRIAWYELPEESRS